MTSIHSPQQLGDVLRAARKQLGLTQPQLALAAGHALVERIITLIEQRCALTIRRLTGPVADVEVSGEYGWMPVTIARPYFPGDAHR